MIRHYKKYYANLSFELKIFALNSSLALTSSISRFATFKLAGCIVNISGSRALLLAFIIPTEIPRLIHENASSISFVDRNFAPEAIWWAMPLTELVTSVYAAYAMRKSLTGLCAN